MAPIDEPPEYGVICLATYKPDPGMFSRQLKSIQDQRLGAFRCLVGADGDADAIRRLVDGAVGPDSRFDVVGFEDRVGFYRNFERLLQIVPQGARWVALADQDDVWHSDKLAELVTVLAEHDLVACQARVVDRRGSPVAVTHRRGTSLIGLVAENQVTGSLSVFRRSLVETALPFPEPTAAAFHDHWLALCAQVGNGIQILPRVLQDYVQHEGQVQGEDTPGLVRAVKRLRGRGQARNTWREMGFELISSRFGWRRRICSEVLRRCPDLPGEIQRELGYVVRPSPLRLAVRLAVSARRGEVPIHRAVAMVVSSSLVRATHQRSDGPC